MTEANSQFLGAHFLPAQNSGCALFSRARAGLLVTLTGLKYTASSPLSVALQPASPELLIYIPSICQWFSSGVWHTSSILPMGKLRDSQQG